LVSKYQSNINEAIGASGGYFLFGSICFVGAIFVIVVMPETKGKSNEDMKNYFLARAAGKAHVSTGLENPSYDADKKD
jgi:facilitated trehalose transporter